MVTYLCGMAALLVALVMFVSLVYVPGWRRTLSWLATFALAAVGLTFIFWDDPPSFLRRAWTTEASLTRIFASIAVLVLFLLFSWMVLAAKATEPPDVAGLSVNQHRERTLKLGPVTKQDGSPDPDGFLTVTAYEAKRRRTASATLASVGALAALGLFLFWPGMFPTTAPPPTPEEMAAREATERDAREAAQQRREQKQQAQVDQARAALDARIAAMVPQFATMKPAARLAAVTTECGAKGACADETLVAIERAGADDAERKRIHAAIARATDARDERDARAQRESFAAEFERELLDKHLNPDSVTASGPNKATLSVHIWLCSKQFLHDLANDELFLAKVRVRGFKRVECANDLGEVGSFNP
jgi:hypothetical protein